MKVLRSIAVLGVWSEATISVQGLGLNIRRLGLPCNIMLVI